MRDKLAYIFLGLMVGYGLLPKFRGLLVLGLILVAYLVGLYQKEVIGWMLNL